MQMFSLWFTEWPTTHELAGRTVEVIAASEIERLQRQRDLLIVALREIADRPTVERNPDGEDQAAATMQLIARETLALVEPRN